MEFTEKPGYPGGVSDSSGQVPLAQAPSGQVPLGQAPAGQVPLERNPLGQAPLELLKSARQEMAKRIVGQTEMIDGLLTALIAGGHILLEGVPGLAKTRAVKTMAEITGLVF
jgi:hypothetical protein